MSTKIFVNLPVTDLEKSKEFFSKLGFEFNQQFTDENAACMIIGAENFVMLLTKDHFKKFTKKQICDTGRETEMILALTAGSREKVDEIFNKAIEAGGTKSVEPMNEISMYNRIFQDLDGHHWEIFFMDESAMNQG
jgi:hypothetical protein